MYSNLKNRISGLKDKLEIWHEELGSPALIAGRFYEEENIIIDTMTIQRWLREFKIKRK